MEIQRVKVPLDLTEMEALIEMADRECRHPEEQLRFLLRLEAMRRGLLTDGNNQGVQAKTKEIGGTDNENIAQR